MVPPDADDCDRLALAAAVSTSHVEDLVTVRDLPMPLPANIRNYFTVIDCTKQDNKLHVKATCNLCDPSEGSKIYLMCDRNTFGLLRHLRVRDLTVIRRPWSDQSRYFVIYDKT